MTLWAMIHDALRSGKQVKITGTLTGVLVNRNHGTGYTENYISLLTLRPDGGHDQDFYTWSEVRDLVIAPRTDHKLTFTVVDVWA